MAIEIPQLTFSQTPPVAFPGTLADTSNHDISSRIAEVAFDAGLGLVKGTNAGQAKLPTGASDITNSFLGVSQYLAAREPTGTSNRYAIGDVVPTIEQGKVWVQIDATAGATLVDEGPVYCVHSGAQAGKFRGDAGVGPAATIVQGAKCKIGGSAGGIAQVKFNLP